MGILNITLLWTLTFIKCILSWKKFKCYCCCLGNLTFNPTLIFLKLPFFQVDPKMRYGFKECIVKRKRMSGLVS